MFVGRALKLRSVVTIFGLLCSAAWAQPIPAGPSTITVSYQTTSGVVSFSGNQPFRPDAVGPPSASALGAAPNISAFNSVNSFGRRTFLANSSPEFAIVLSANETLISHAFFKKVPGMINAAFFPDLVAGGNITVSVGPIEFNECVQVDPATVMLHVLWNGDQVDQLFPKVFINLHNHHIDAGTFRDVGDFLDGGVFSNFPIPSYVYNNVKVDVTGNGSRKLTIKTTFPYALLENLESTGGPVPGGLPAPQGFLEPFHFHIEYAVSDVRCVVPSTSTWSVMVFTAIMVVGASVVMLRKHGKTARCAVRTSIH